MILLAEAERAKSIAKILQTFLNYDLDSRRTIETTTDRLDDLSAVLHDLDGALEARDRVVFSMFADDLELLQHSVAYTLGDLWMILGAMPDESIGHDYRDTWKEIARHCRSTSKESLPMRIETYSLFAAALTRVLKSEPQRRGIHIEDLRSDIVHLRRAQLNDRRLITAADAINDLSTMRVQRKLAPPPTNVGAMRQPRSSERVRPPNIRTGSVSTNASHDSRPFVPSPPLSPHSPTNTFSTISESQASSGEIETKHWAGRIFKDLPSTKITDEKNQKAVSRCHPLQNDSRSWPDSREYNAILKINFPGGLRFHYYVRDKDYRAKIACEWPSDRRRIDHSCVPLNELHAKRDASMLYLCRAIAGYSNNTVWAAFKFPTIEFLIIFHCTFLALRSQDGRRQFRSELFDHELKGETRVFAGPINDNEYHHALRIYRDRATGTLRLEAAVLDGPMKNTPVWTAFITHQVTSPTWLERNEKSRKVYLGDLKRHIFSSQYTPHVAPSGQHVLAFDKTSDAEGFQATIKDLRIRYWEEARRQP